MNINSKNRAKNRSAIGSHVNPSLQNMTRNDSKSQIKQKSSNDRPVTPEGVYFNARLMHCTTSLIGCVVQIQTKDGTQYEGVLRTFSPEFELVVDYVTKIESNYSPNVGSNIANLLLSLQSNNNVSPRVIFKFQDVVKLNAINIDLDFAANKGLLLTDSEISRFDSKPSNREKDKELVPWDGGHGDCDDSFDSLSLDEHNGVGTTAQNGWSPDEMFKVNESKFKVKSTYDPTLPDYTCPLIKGEGPDYEEKQKTALELAQQIESDPSRIERYAREDADDEDKYSAVVRPNDDDKYASNARPNDDEKYNTGGRHNEHLRRNKKQNNYPVNNSSGAGSGPPPRQQRMGLSSNSNSTAPPFHSNKNSNNYNKQFSGGNTGNSYPSSQSSHKPQTFRDETVSPFSNSGQTFTKSGENDESSHQSAGPQRNVNENRRSAPLNKRKEEMTDLKKFSNDFKLPSNVDTPKDKDNVCHKSESQLKHSSSGFSAKSKSPVGAGDTIPVKDKSGDSVIPPSVEDSKAEKESREVVRDSSDQRDSNETIDSNSANSSIVSAPDTEIAKKSTLNPNAKTFTPRSPMTPLTTSATPPSVASTPSSTVSVPNSGQNHSGPHSLSQGHGQQTQVGPSQSATHASQARFPNPLVQIPQQYNVITPGLGPLLAHNQYLMTNVAAMAPHFAQSNPNQQRNYRNKGPQQYSHGVRHEFTQQSAHVAAAVTGHPVLAAAPIGAPQTVSYGPQQTTTMVAQQGPPQHMYQHMYQFQPRMNVLPQHSAAMQMAVPQAVQYDPTQLHQIYTTGVNAVQLQHLVSQAHQHMTNSGPHSGHSTPQSATPTTPLHGGPAPSPVHHQPNQPPTPTPQQSVMYANVTSGHNPQNPNVGHHGGQGVPYQTNIVILPNGQAMASGHHSGGHGGPLHAAAHALSHNTTANHSGGQATLVHLIAGSNAQNALAATFNTNPGV